VNVKSTGYKHPNGEEVDGTLEPEYKIADYDLTLKGKLQTSNRYEGTVSLNDKLVKGSTLFLTGKAELGSKPKQSIEAGFDYLNKDFASLNLKFISPTSFNMEDVEIYAAGTSHAQGISGGADIQFKPTVQEISKWNVFAQYDDSDNSIGVFGKFDKEKKSRVAGFGVYRNIEQNLKGALEFSIDTLDTSKTTLKVGTNYQIDDSSSLKSKISVFGTNQFRIGNVYKQTLTSTSKLTFINDINANLLLDKKADSGIGHQFGVTLSFFD